MTTQQLLVFGVLALTLAFFIWNRWRYDIVAMLALLAVVLLGLVPPREAFAGFGHPAVIMVAAVLVLSRGLTNAGVVDSVARILWRVGDSPAVQVPALTGTVALLSAFMNNIGALALLMPVAITISRRRGSPPSILLMPLAFGSLLGGMLTLIGTPPNIIISSYREQAGLDAFRMFDFFPVGAGVAVVGLVFISLIGWRLTPQRVKEVPKDDLFDISDYIAEAEISEDSKFVGSLISEFVAAVQEDAEVLILGLSRAGQWDWMPSMYGILRGGDVLLVEADHDGLQALVDVGDAEVVGMANRDDRVRQEVQELDLREVIITAESRLVGSTVTTLDLRKRYGVNIAAVARQGGQLRRSIRTIRFEVGDILLVQGLRDAVSIACSELSCLPLADRGLRLRTPRGMPRTLSIFGAALGLSALGWLPAEVALSAGAVAMVLAGVVSLQQAYKSIDLSIIILLAAMIPIGQALETSGGAQLIADGLSQVSTATSTPGMLAILMVGTMLLSNVVNNAAAAILIAPIALKLASAMVASPDPFLMAVAIAASAAFLTPIGHQSCTLVMAPGGYQFGDYWRMGLPLSIVVIATAVPLILWIWPPFPV